MPEVVYSLCFLMALVCAVLLTRSYFARRSSLLMWSSLCFVGLAISNLLLVIDLVITGASVDLSVVRQACALVALAMLTIGLVREVR
jgi:hypothetical protein